MTPSAKLRFLADTVLAAAEDLQMTDGRLFAVPMTPERAAGLRNDIDLLERTDAFVARFGRLQDTLADKLLPVLLDWLSLGAGGAGHRRPQQSRATGLDRFRPDVDRSPPIAQPHDPRICA